MKKINLQAGDKDVLKAICENSSEGYTVSEMRIALKTIDAIMEAEDVLILDDAYHQYMLKQFNATKFVKPDAAILGLLDRIQ